MKSMIQCSILVAIFFLFCFPISVYAYIDLGTGSFMLQVLIAGIVGALFAIKLYLKRIIGVAKKLFKKDDSRTPR